jgi:nitroimidazol reductase NimA-like FMN-containing flavoprotein (pyridoxamine 5'-phosphate oxidase superfamily)
MEHIKKILAANLIGTLATINEDGSPWATTVHVFSDDTAVYWFSKDTHQHSRNIARDPRVALSVWSKSEGTAGGYISGTAVKLSVEETTAALRIVVDTIGAIPPYFAGTFGYKLEIGAPDLSKSSEKRWYFYS